MTPFPALELLVLSGSTVLSVRASVPLNDQKQPIHLFCSFTTAVFAPLLIAPVGWDLIHLIYHLPLTLFLPFSQHLVYHSIPFIATFKTCSLALLKHLNRRVVLEKEVGVIQFNILLLFLSFIQCHVPCWYLVFLFPLSYNPFAYDLFSSTSVVLKL